VRHLSIPWQPMLEMPPDRRDGRHVLLWTDAAPGGAFVCRWVEHLRRWMSRGPIIEDPTYWADITDPRAR
jgi:hypothetical protein